MLYKISPIDWHTVGSNAVVAVRVILTLRRLVQLGVLDDEIIIHEKRSGISAIKRMSWNSVWLRPTNTITTARTNLEPSGHG
jgi:hypothetical protein